MLSADPAPPHWGGNASLYAWSAAVNMTNPSDAPLHPHWTFNYSYDWTLSASRYDHAQGQHDEVCKMAITPGDPCTVLNALDGKLYLLGPSSCCRCDASWAPFTIVPDWLARSNATYEGSTSVGGQEADEWLAYGASDNHYYASVDSSRKPFRYMEHKNGKLKQWDFSDWQPVAPPRSVFEPPPGCDAICSAALCHS